MLGLAPGKIVLLFWRAGKDRHRPTDAGGLLNMGSRRGGLSFGHAMEDGRFAIVKASYWSRRDVVWSQPRIPFIGVSSLSSSDSYVDNAMRSGAREDWCDP